MPSKTSKASKASAKHTRNINREPLVRVWGTSDDLRCNAATRINNSNTNCPAGHPIRATYIRSHVTVKCDCIRNGEQLQYTMECTGLYGYPDALTALRDLHTVAIRDGVHWSLWISWCAHCTSGSSLRYVSLGFCCLKSIWFDCTYCFLFYLE